MLLHAIVDPLCGWCYAAEPLLQKAQEMKLPLRLHYGGLFTGAQRPETGADFSQYVRAHDQKIHQITQQEFSDAYYETIAQPSQILDSEKPTAALLAIEELGGSSLLMLQDMQKSHYIKGRLMVAEKTLIHSAQQQKLNGDFETKFSELKGAKTQQHIQKTRRFMSKIGCRSFPTFVMENQGHYNLIDHQKFYGQIDAWQSFLSQ